MSNINVNNITPQTGTKVSVSGSLHASGDITAFGNITLGDQNTDEIVFAADISSSIIPVASNTYDLGASNARWKHTHASHSRVSILGSHFSGLDISVSASLVPMYNQTHNLGRSGNLNWWNKSYVSASYTEQLAPLTTNQQITVSASLLPLGHMHYNLGNDNNTWNLMHSSASMTYRLGYKNPTTKGIEVSASLHPDRNVIRDLGSTWNAWRQLHAESIVTTNISASHDGVISGSGPNHSLGGLHIGRTYQSAGQNNLIVEGTVTASGLTPLNSAGQGGTTDELVQVSGSQLFSGSSFIGMSSTGFIQPWVSSSIFVFKA